MQNNILVIGGTGKTGRKVAERLSQQNHHVRIGSRQAALPFDWHKPSTWAPALAGMDKVYITYQPDLAVPGAFEAITGLISEAKKQQIKKVVLLSGKGEREAERCEQVVIDSGLDHTIVRASWFSQNFSESFLLEPILAGHVALPKASVQIPFIDTDDIADVVVASLLDEKHNGEIYELTGPRLWTFPQVVDEIARATEREIQFTPISMEAYSNMLKEFGLPDDYIWLITYLFNEVLETAENQLIANGVERALGRKAKDLSDYVQETAKTGVWNVKQMVS